MVDVETERTQNRILFLPVETASVVAGHTCYSVAFPCLVAFLGQFPSCLVAAAAFPCCHAPFPCCPAAVAFPYCLPSFPSDYHTSEATGNK